MFGFASIGKCLPYLDEHLGQVVTNHVIDSRLTL